MNHANNFPKLHNAAWPGVVGKGEGSEPPIDLDTMLDLTAAAEVDGVRSSTASICSCSIRMSASTRPTTQLEEAGREGALARNLVDRLGRRPRLAADRRRLGDGRRRRSQASFSTQVRKGCRIARTLREMGIRPYGVVRIDSACGVGRVGREIPKPTRKRIADTFRKACDIAEEFGERLAAEGEICWGGMHSCAAHGRAARSGRTARKRSAFRPTWPTRSSIMLGHNAPEDASCRPTSTGTTRPRSTPATKQLTDALRPWTIDFHVAQNNGDGPRLRQPRQNRPPLPAERPPTASSTSSKYAGYWLRDADGKPDQERSSTSAGTAACSPTKR